MELELLLEEARSWQAQDPDPLTSEQIREMIHRADLEELTAHFGSRLQFGTAGIRGRLGPGPRRMNRALVRQVTAGLGHYLLEQGVPREKGVVIGFDGRHGSEEFAEDASRVLGGLGFRVHLFTQVVPTPTLAHAVVFLGAAAGIMVTASHNPPQDNGYKVYWSNGAQIIPPHDRGISQAIDRVGALSALAMPSMDALGDRLLEIPEEVAEDYLRRVLALRVHEETGALAVYTAMHGVGWKLIRDVLQAAGHRPPIAVPEQRDPDGDFPTVSFPNPEEPGALDLAMALARQESADLIIANDPDADRLAVALPTAGGWKMLSGNQVGLLLAEDLLTHGPQQADRLVANTIVSSSLLNDIARAHGAIHVETLTGFKWIANAAIDHEGPFVIGFEEALGYSIGPVVRDKDGVSAALILLDLASHAKARGETLLDCLESLYRRYGLIAARQHALTLPGDAGAQQIQEIMSQLRANPPLALAGTSVVQMRDLHEGRCVDIQTGQARTETLPKSNVLALVLEGGDRVLARPSGTEPKIKFYFEARVQMASGEGLEEAQSRALKRIAMLQADLLKSRLPVLS
jgi:phosphomannomutase